MSKTNSLLTVMLGMTLGLSFGPSMKAQNLAQQHVITSDELNQEVARPAEVRQSNEEAVRHLLSSEAGQNALKSANVDYERVDKAIGQLSDEDLSKLADRSRKAESDFAAGAI